MHSQFIEERQKTLVGAEVEAIFDGDFFDGKIVDVNLDGTFKVEFDDGDVEEKARAGDIRLKSVPSTALNIAAVIAKFDDEWYDGTISQVNDDGTFHVKFDDGDENKETSKSDIRIADKPHAASAATLALKSTTSKSNKQDEDGEEEEEDDDDDDDYGEDDFEEEGEDATAISSKKSKRSSRNSLSKAGDEFASTGFEDAASVAQESAANIALTAPSIIEEAVSIKSSNISGFEPGCPCEFQAKLDALSTNKETYLMAEPGDRLFVLFTQLATLAQQQWHLEMAGGAWTPEELMYATTDPILDEKGVSAVVLRMRMRAIALVRLTYGEHSLEMVQALVDLASCYARSKLWPQVSAHANRATQFIVQVTAALEEGSSNPLNDDLFCLNNTSVQKEARVVLDFIQVLREAVVGEDLDLMEEEGNELFDGLRQKENLNEITNHLVASLPQAKKEAGSCKWAWLITFLRKQTWFAGKVQKFLNSIRKDYLAIVRLAFKSQESGSKDIVKDGRVFIQMLKQQVDFSDMVGSKNMLSQLECRSLPNCKEKHGLLYGTRPSQEKCSMCSQPIKPLERVHYCSQCRYYVCNSCDSRDVRRKVPILWEEVLALMVDSRSENSSEVWTADLRASVMLLVANIQKHQGRHDLSYDNALKALQVLESVGRKGTRNYCQLTTMAAEALVLMQKERVKKGPARRRQLAEEWLESEEGACIWQREVLRLITESKQAGRRLTNREVEERTKEALVKARMARIKEKERANGELSATTGPLIDEALKRLLKAWEMQKKALGESHVYSGRACLALSQFYLMQKNDEQATLWLQSALTIFDAYFENFAPVIVTTELQLGRVMVSRSESTQMQGFDHITRAVELTCGKFFEIKGQLVAREEGVGAPEVSHNRLSQLFLSVGERAMSLLKDAVGIFDAAEDYERALECSKKMQAVAEALYGTTSMIVAKLSVALGQRLHHFGLYEDAKDAYTKSYQIRIIHHGKDKKVRELQAVIKRLDQATAAIMMNKRLLKNEDYSDSDGDPLYGI